MKRNSHTAIFTVLMMAGFHCLVHTSSDAQNTRAQQILSATGVTGGIIVHLECGDGALAAALATDGRFLVQGLVLGDSLAVFLRS